jgi:hypothetical protein
MTAKLENLESSSSWQEGVGEQSQEKAGQTESESWTPKPWVVEEFRFTTNQLGKWAIENRRIMGGIGL